MYEHGIPSNTDIETSGAGLDHTVESNYFASSGGVFDYIPGTDENVHATYVVKKFDKNDSRFEQEDTVKARRKEVDVLRKRKTCRVVKQEDVPHDAKIIGARFVMTLKNMELHWKLPKQDTLHKATTPKKKVFFTHDASVLCPYTARMIDSFSAFLSRVETVWTRCN